MSVTPTLIFLNFADGMCMVWFGYYHRHFFLFSLKFSTCEIKSVCNEWVLLSTTPPTPLVRPFLNVAGVFSWSADVQVIWTLSSIYCFHFCEL